MLFDMAHRPIHRTNEERSAHTRRLLVGAARQLFEERGYADTGIGDVAAEAGVTRGALYHHFPTKQALFDAVIVDIQDELATDVDRAASKNDDAWDRFVAAWLVAVENAPSAGIRRLMLEAPAVLGHQRWMQIDDEHFLSNVTANLRHLADRGLLDVEPTPTVARVLLTISNALMTLVAQTDQPDGVRMEVTALWERFLRSLAPPSQSRTTPEQGQAPTTGSQVRTRAIRSGKQDGGESP